MAKISGAKNVVRPHYSSFSVELTRNILVALSVSFVALSLGAAFGILSERGAFFGMLSAGLIAFIAAAIGGTRVQCSGPTAPMAAIMAGLVAWGTQVYAQNPDALGGMTPDHYFNLVCLLCGGIMVLMAVLRTGKFIAYVPEMVISGFMTGIGLIIWTGQAQVLFGIGKMAFTGGIAANVTVAAMTLALTFWATDIVEKISKTMAKIIPGTLIALVVMVGVVVALGLRIETVSLGAGVKSAGDMLTLVAAQIPRHVSWGAIKMGLPVGFELALISYLDSLMVALIIDRMTGEKTKLNQELAAQGVANVAVGFIGGVPGTQASIRSVMMVKEGATMRLAGMMVGVFVFIEILVFQGFVTLIPKAVFSGILLKVGWNVCDKEPIRDYVLRRKGRPSTLDFITLVGTALVTMWNLSVAVVFFTLFYYTALYWQNKRVRAKAPLAEQERYIAEIMHDKP
jgi:SulP family sulfate permease